MVDPSGGAEARSTAREQAPLTWREHVGIGLSGLIGALIAVLADLTQNSEASALRIIRDRLDQYLALSATTEWALPTVPAMVMLLLVFLGVALCFVFEVRNKRAGLYVGASIISLIATLVPYQPANPVGVTVPGGSALASASGASEGAFLRIAQPAVNHVELQIRAPRLPNDATVELRNADTRQIVGRTTYELTGGEGGSRIAFEERPGRYLLTVDAPGYASYRCRFELTMDVAFDVDLQASGFLGPIRDYLFTGSQPCEPLDDTR